MNEKKLSKPFSPTPDQLRDLAKRLHDAYKELCKLDKCQCVTEEEHRRMLVS